MIWIEPVDAPQLVGLTVVPSAIVGVAGSVKLIDPVSMLDVQPAIVTPMFVYVPALNPEIVIWPEELLTSAVPTETPPSK